MKTVRVDGSKIKDWDSFHAVFAEAFGFPDFYGQNMDAWIDCMTSLDETFSAVQVEAGHLVCIALDAADVFKKQSPEQFQAFVECSAFVNWRRLDMDRPAILVLSFHAS